MIAEEVESKDIFKIGVHGIALQKDYKNLLLFTVATEICEF